MRYGRFLAVSAAIVALGLSLLTPEAQAYDRKGYSGNICQTYFASTSSQIDHQRAGVYNRSSSTGAWVSCPIVRDNSFDTAGPGDALWVRVFRSSSSQALDCYLVTLDWAGAVIRGVGRRYTGVGAFWMPLLISGAGYSQAWGSYVMYCWLPPQSGIITYNVYERSPTDSNN